MKKEAFLFLIAILLISKAGAVQYSCPNELDLQTKSEEILEGSTKSMLSVPLGICGAIESSVYGWIETQVFIDSRLLTIQGTNTTEGTDLVSGNTSVSYSNPAADSIKIKIGSTEQDIDLGDCTTVNNHAVMLKEISGSGSSSVAKILVGKSKAILNTQSNPGDIIDFLSKKYSVQILGGSHTSSAIKISTCDAGDITEIASPAINASNTTNSNLNNTASNSNSTTQNNQSSANTQNQSNQSSQGFIIEPSSDTSGEKIGFFRRIWEWIKGLFVRS